MTNLERVKEEMRIEDVANFGGLPCNIIHKIKNEVNCSDRSCKECELWLADEYVEHIILTEAERVILENIDKEHKYIARDKDGEIRFFIDKPQKLVGDFWGSARMNDSGFVFNHLFQFVQWENEEPYEIAKLLEEK